MITKVKPALSASLQDLINDLQEQMLETNYDTEEYARMLNQLSTLYKLKELDRPKPQISRDTLVLVAGNLVGILMILNYEKVGVVTSRAIGFVTKLR